MRVRVLRGALKYNGQTYTAGSTVNLPDTLATRLIAASPHEFAAVNPIEAPLPSVQPTVTAPVQDDLDDMRVADLRRMAADLGIKLPAKGTHKQDYIDAIRKANADSGDIAELPAADLAGTVRRK